MGKGTAFFDVDGSTARSSLHDQVGLAAEKGRNLQQVHMRSGQRDILRRVDVGGDWYTEVCPDTTENFAALAGSKPTKGASRGAVGFVVGGLENEGLAQLLG